ncbi:hypothetical protein [Streptomyces sp. NPDC085466]
MSFGGRGEEITRITSTQALHSALRENYGLPRPANRYTREPV